MNFSRATSWKDEQGVDPYKRLDEYDRATRVDRMVRDVGRYLPAVLEAKYVDSLFEVKTVLVKNEGDDGRPILFEKHAELPGCYSVLGGKSIIFTMFSRNSILKISIARVSGIHYERQKSIFINS